MVKIAFWDQKSSFFQSYYKCSYGRYMAGNMLLGCPRHILRAFLISGSDLVHFWKNRKKWIFWPIFCDLTSYIYIYIMNPANYRPYDIAAGSGHLRAVFNQKCHRLCILVPPVTHILWFCEKVEKWPFLEYSRKTATVLLFCCRNVANQKVWNQGFLLHQESSPYLY